jgi:hypothetical protein
MLQILYFWAKDILSYGGNLLNTYGALYVTNEVLMHGVRPFACCD